MGTDAQSELAAQAAIPLAIKGRAAAIQANGVYLGFFDWLAFCGACKIRVVMLFGSNCIDLVATFAPGIAELQALPADSRGLVVVVTAMAGPELLEAHYNARGRPCMNHFVLGVPIAGSVPPPPSTIPQDRRGAPRAAILASRAAGFELKLTESCGNCALDTACMLLGRDRTAAEWKRLRLQVSRFMDGVAADLRLAGKFGTDVRTYGTEYRPVPPPTTPSSWHTSARIQKNWGRAGLCERPGCREGSLMDTVRNWLGLALGPGPVLPF